VPVYLYSADYFIKFAECEKTINHAWTKIKRDENAFRDENVTFALCPIVAETPREGKLAFLCRLSAVSS
jgi:hypothetical protein